MPTGDHPRSRGVYCTTVHPPGARRGSSPLARGLPKEQALAVLRLGIIPARAGFTGARARATLPTADHPRSRGVYRRGLWPRCRPRGSSPLARGLRRHRRSFRGVRGIIPARAGFTFFAEPLSKTGADHPRSRGVYPVGASGVERWEGSSPLARGLHALPHQRPGIIPARAGFTWCPLGLLRCRWDHPRSRGVYIHIPLRICVGEGSSPLARGLPAPGWRGGWSVSRGERRIIPARAGFTCAPKCARSCPTDHPRSRGVYRRPRAAGSSAAGSSPLARGLRAARRPARGGGGIIPARAGFTDR